MSKRPEIEESMDELVQNIGKLAEKMKDLSQQAVKLYSVEADAIIKEQTHDSHRIERCLDGMLGFCSDEEMLALYKTLCRYYYYINPEATVFYVNAYREMWDDKVPVNE